VERHPAVLAHYGMLADTYRRIANVRVRNRATVGGNLSHGDYRLDPPAPLIALDARLKLCGPDGEREIPLAEFFRGYYEVNKGTGEILTEILVPPAAENSRGTYIKFVGNAAADWPIVGVAALLRTAKSGQVDDLRIVLSCVAATPLKVSGLEKLTFGRQLSPNCIASVAEAAANQADPIEDTRGSIWYKREMIRVHVRRALEQLSDDSGG
ncbi:MAG TPA: FAD binding domain-containing protein, partial [Nitrospiria bacterium]